MKPSTSKKQGLVTRKRDKNMRNRQEYSSSLPWQANPKAPTNPFSYKGHKGLKKKHFSGMLLQGSWMKRLDKMNPRIKKSHWAQISDFAPWQSCMHQIFFLKSLSFWCLFMMVQPSLHYMRYLFSILQADNGEPGSVPNNEGGIRVEALIKVVGLACHNEQWGDSCVHASFAWHAVLSPSTIPISLLMCKRRDYSPGW